MTTTTTSMASSNRPRQRRLRDRGGKPAEERGQAGKPCRPEACEGGVSYYAREATKAGTPCEGQREGG